MASGRSTIAEVAALLIEDIWSSKGKEIKKSEFLGRYVHIFDSELLDKCITTLCQAEFIKLCIGANGNGESYTVTDKCKEKFELK